MELQDFRRQYLQNGLRRSQLQDNPIVQFEVWLEQAIASGISDPTAMTLATVDAKGQPQQRIVLLKKIDQAGFVFFTNMSSRKGCDIALNSCVSLHFPWHPLERQVSVVGHAEMLDRDAVDDYFHSRPEASQIAAWASDQSSVIPSRDYLMERFSSITERYAHATVPTPDQWGGYRVVPRCIEFWQGGENRLHDRFEYRRVNTDNTDTTPQWDIQRLAP